MSFSGRPDYAPIHDLQTMLRTVVPEQGLGRDGLYGEETKQAVAAFQRKQGMEANGITDQETWDALKREFLHKEIARAPAEPLLIILQPNQVIERGSDNLHLYLIQGMLRALSRLDPEIPETELSGTLDAQTEQALLWLQRLGGLEENGSVDKQTWRQLAKQYRLMIGDGTGRIPIRRVQRPASEDRAESMVMSAE